MLFTNYLGKQMYSKNIYKQRRPIDEEVTLQNIPTTKYIGNPPPAKYYRKTGVCDCNLPKVIQVINNVDCCKTDKQKIIRSANTNLSKDYYTSSSQLLQQRCKTYEQNITAFEKTVGSSQIRPDCNNCPDGNPRVAYYKRSNPNFNKQGAVSSSARLVRLKYNAITTSSKFNPEQPRYRGDTTNNVLLQQYTPICTHRIGNKNICR
jgi:hypothetical protein